MKKAMTKEELVKIELFQEEFDALNSMLEELTTDGLYAVRDYIQTIIDECEQELAAIRRVKC